MTRGFIDTIPAKSYDYNMALKASKQALQGLSGKKPKLEIVLKCDSVGSLEAITSSLASLTTAGAEIDVIHGGVGAISKSDILFAETASRLIVGFQTEVMPHMDKEIREHGIEVRLFEVIYKLIDDISTIAAALVPHFPEERIIGQGRIIALFKSSRKGIIIGCDVQEGFFAVGEHFRIISAMGPIYAGTIDSLHIRDAAVQKATAGQQCGIRIKHFSGAKAGDIVESFRPPQATAVHTWEPTGQIIRK